MHLIFHVLNRRFFVTGCGAGLDIAFVVDSSGSIQHERFPLVIEYLASIVSQLSVSEGDTRVAAVKWSDDAGLEFNLNTYRNRQDVIQGIRLSFTLD